MHWFLVCREWQAIDQLLFYSRSARDYYSNSAGNLVLPLVNIDYPSHAYVPTEEGMSDI